MTICKWCKKEVEILNYYELCAECVTVINSEVSKKQKEIYEELNAFNRCRNPEAKKLHADSAISSAESLLQFEQLQIVVIKPSAGDVIQSIKDALENQKVEVKKPKTIDILPPNRPKKKEKRKIPTTVQGVSFKCPNTNMDRQLIIEAYLSPKDKLIPRPEPYNTHSDHAVGLWFYSEQKWFHLGYLEDYLGAELTPVILEGREVDVTIKKITGGTALKEHRGLSIVISYWD